MNENYVVVDCETTGLNPEKDKLIEIACAFRRNGVLYYASNLINPGQSIPPDVSGITHLTDEDVKDAPQAGDVISEKGFPTGILVAHNARFDQQFLLIPNRSWLCTMRVSMHLWPECPNFKNQTLRYFLGVKVDIPRGLAPHRALYDVLVTEAIFQEMLQKHSLEELLILQDKPVLQRTIRFGKHKGQEWNSVPKDYLSWLLRQDQSGGIDEDCRHTARHWLNA